MDGLRDETEWTHDTALNDSNRFAPGYIGQHVQ
jgi:hypothetical protein